MKAEDRSAIGKSVRLKRPASESFIDDLAAATDGTFMRSSKSKQGTAYFKPGQQGRSMRP
jgi:hypothetical protein